MKPWMRSLLGVTFIAGLSGPAPAADLGAMPASEIVALQRRLTDAKCYSGALDGAASDDLAQAVKACPTQDPQLRIENGMHGSAIWSIGVDRACTMAVTGSDDKTVRLWSLPDGRPLRTLLVPTDQANGGKIYAVAMSADGRFVAAGGWDGEYDISGKHAVYIFEAATGALVSRFTGLENVVDHLAFSPDGHWLAITLASGHGVRVLDTSTWDAVAADTPYGDASLGADFSADNHLFTVSYDGKLRHYGPGPTFAKQREILARGGHKPFSISVDPSGRLLGVGFLDTPKVDFYDAVTLSYKYSADTAFVDYGNVGSVVWSNDGQRLIAAGTYHAYSKTENEWRSPILTFDRSGHRAAAPMRLSHNTVMDPKPCGDGFAIAAQDPGFGLVGHDGRTLLWKEGVVPDMRTKLDEAFTMSSDAKTVRFGLGVGADKPVAFDLTAASLTDAPNVPQGLLAPRVDGLPVSDWKNTTAPKFAGQVLPLNQYDIARAVAVRADRQGFVLGSSYAVTAFDAHGKQLWRRNAPSEADGVNISPEGRLVVAAYADGTVRWHRWSDGAELLALFTNKDTKAWVAWTPTGYYMSSAGGEDMIGWRLNRGWDQAGDFFPASRFRDRFNRPDIVQLVLDTLDEAEAVKQANSVSNRKDTQRAIIERLPPVLTITSPNDGSKADVGTVDIHYTTRSPSGAKVDRVEAFVDGAKVQVRGLARGEPTAAEKGGLAKGESAGVISLPMPARDVTISLVAYADGLAGDPAKIQLKGPVQAAAEAAAGDVDDALKPTLYALLIGVSHYGDSKYDLAYPAKDATDLAEAFKSQKGKLYRDVEVRVLTDKEATTTAVKRGLSWLRKQTTAHDLAIVFAAGHGTTDAKGKFWFLTSDMDPDDIGATAVSREDIADVLFDLPGKKLLFLDACHSGAALNPGARGIGQGGTDVTAALNDFAQAEGGVVAYAASTGREFSFERDDWGHGAFTKALIEAFGENKADLLHNGTLTTGTLDLFLEKRVKELTGGQQHPVMTRPKTVPDFPIALSQR